MSQQISIFVFIDIPAALKENTLDNNIYFLDNLKREGSEGEGTDKLLTAVNGYHWIDGSQACDIVLNWFPIGIGCLPMTLPRSYSAYRSGKIEKEVTQSMLRMYQNSNAANGDLQEKIEEMRVVMEDSVLLETNNREIIDLGIKTLNLYGDLYQKDDEPDILNYISPRIVALRGEAVDNSVLFPSQYGSPVESSEGLYWSATVDTLKTGIHTYILDIILYEKDRNNLWRPRPMTYKGRIKVSTEAKRNGFTHAGTGLLPVI